MSMLNTTEQAVKDLELILALDMLSCRNTNVLAKRVEEYKIAISLQKSILHDERNMILKKQSSLGVDGVIIPTSIADGQWNKLQKQLKIIDRELYA